MLHIFQMSSMPDFNYKIHGVENHNENTFPDDVCVKWSPEKVLFGKISGNFCEIDTFSMTFLYSQDRRFTKIKSSHIKWLLHYMYMDLYQTFSKGQTVTSVDGVNALGY